MSFKLFSPFNIKNLSIEAQTQMKTKLRMYKNIFNIFMQYAVWIFSLIDWYPPLSRYMNVHAVIVMTISHSYVWIKIFQFTWFNALPLFCLFHHYGDAIMSRVWLRLTSPASRLFTQPLFQAQIKENIKAPRHWPLCGEFTGDQWIPRTKGQLCGNCVHLMTSSWWIPQCTIRISHNAQFCNRNGHIRLQNIEFWVIGLMDCRFCKMGILYDTLSRIYGS